MIKRFFVILLLAGCWQTSVADGFESATSAVRNMRVGWNLGNTLESNSGDVKNMWIEKWSSRKPSDYETAWGQPVTKPELLAMFKEAGFNAIRVPVTWYPHMEAKFQLNGTVWDKEKDDIGTKIQAKWMKRVHEVVDYVISQGMYCILNVHHDTGDASTAWLVADEAVYAEQKERFEAVWRQIAEEFKDYDEHLLFEGYNEMLDSHHSWCFASYATSLGYDSKVAASAYKAINGYAQSFVDAVRSTGGNNRERNLIVNTYCASSGSQTWNTHLQDPLKQMKLPVDSVSDHLIFEVHSYIDIKNLGNAKSEVRQMISNLKKYLVPKGAPVIFGEWGTTTENGYADYRENMLAFARYFVEQAKASNMGTLYWMGLSDGKSRSVPEFNQADLKDAIIKGYYGEDGLTGVDAMHHSQFSVHNSQFTMYDLQGRRIPATAHGFFIRKGSDGKMKKIVR